MRSFASSGGQYSASSGHSRSSDSHKYVKQGVNLKKKTYISDVHNF
jgi:hypothetical protein